MKTKIEFIIMKEGIIQSIAKDVFTFGVLIAVAWVNFNHLGNHPAIVWFVCLSIFVGAISYRRKRYTKNEAIKYIESLGE